MPNGSERLSIEAARLEKISRCLLAKDLTTLRDSFGTQYSDISRLINPDVARSLDSKGSLKPVKCELPLDVLTGLDVVNYLPDDILVKVDRASMRHSLEARAPLLDYRLVEFAQRLPPDLKLREGQSKWLLKTLLYRHIPAALVDRPKQGFRLPVGTWLRGDLRPWSEAIFADSHAQLAELLNMSELREIWHQHLRGHHDHQGILWNVLSLAEWLNNQMQVQQSNTPVVCAAERTSLA